MTSPAIAWPIPLRGPAPAAKARASSVRNGTPMSLEALAAILVFVAVLAGLNYFEYHRFD